MRDSFPFSSSRVLAAIATGALLAVIIVVITGGFVLHAGPLFFSARRPVGPLIVAAAAAALLARGGRSAWRDAGAAVTAFVGRWAAAIAALFALASAAVGISLGTYTAAGADAAGYVSQAHLIASGTLVRAEPLAHDLGWPQPEWTLSSLGYRPGPLPGEIVPTYPPGLPLVMAAFVHAGGELGPFVVVPLLGAIAVLSAFALGATLHSRLAGLVAAALLATSPIVLFQIVQPMSDVPAAAWWSLALLLASTPAAAAPLAAGAAAGLAFLTRPNLLPLALVVLGVAVAPPRRQAPAPRWRTAVLFAAAITPAIVVQALLNARLYGGMLISSYGTAGDLFTLSTVLPNLRDYSLRIVEGELPAVILGIVAVAATVGYHSARRRDAAVVAAAVAGITLACYLPYARFAEWSYLRFLLPAFPPAFVLIGALAADALERLSESKRGVVALVAVTTVCSFNVLTARREQAFNLHRFEERYRTTGKYVQAALPANTTVFAVQESASIQHYSGFPVVRWDQLPVDLDVAIARLRALGRHPVIVVEDHEMDGLESKFPNSHAARLDWPPVADVGNETRVRLFDPGDHAALTDRIP